MNFGYREVCLDHDTGPRHPESPDRLRAVRRALKEKHGVEYVDAPDVDLDLLRSVHDPDYVESFREFCADGGGDWDADTVAVEGTWNATLAAAGVAVWAAETALEDPVARDTPFALGRPPGHHALEDDAMGFCFVNNVAVAAQAALDGAADTVAIFDWDVHHGNGTQEIFYDHEDVFYASIHEDGLFPGTGAIAETGDTGADGTNLNVKYQPGADTADYLAALDEYIAPAIVDYDPDLLLISAGFDAHQHDPISRMRVSTEGYGAMTARVRETAAACDAGLGFVLEGGYGLDTLSDSVTMVHEVFDGYTPMEPDDDVSDEARDVLDEVEAQGFGSK
ncbi:histone deacetylase family protein [Halomicroarcula sp. GCM10025324]|uniref:histone deacetylase family protein n=1 Tax=Haloarcula TaxID=2237 RepID=UPI0023E7640E|nr:histone deacetylase [Halomicroarcula sp. ZS-22-S1]